MGTREDYAAAVDHENYVRSQTNDANQINIAHQATLRAQQRADNDNPAGNGPAQAKAIAESNPLYGAVNWLMGGK